MILDYIQLEYSHSKIKNTKDCYLINMVRLYKIVQEEVDKLFAR